MKQYPPCSAASFLGDQLVFRNLEPLDPTLPSLADLREKLNIPAPQLPRKTSRDYARVIHQILLAKFPEGYDRLIYIGDTQFNDGSAFRNLVSVSGCQGAGLICSELPQQPACLHWKPEPSARFFIANRWNLVPAFLDILTHQNFMINDRCAVILDLDKTTLGARGRNDQVIDHARLEAAYLTARENFSDFDESRFSRIYNELNQPLYHAITADNQDFLVYLCLVVYDGVLSLEEIQVGATRNTIHSFQEIATLISQHKSSFSPHMAELHENFSHFLNLGDPTPFKQFRQNEYRHTVKALQHEETPLSLELVLANKIVITAEILNFARYCIAQGAGLLAISDKPDEASLPTPEMQQQGYLPLHQVTAHVVGQ